MFHFSDIAPKKESDMSPRVSARNKQLPKNVAWKQNKFFPTFVFFRWSKLLFWPRDGFRSLNV